MTLEEFKDEVIKRKSQAESKIIYYEGKYNNTSEEIYRGELEGKIMAYATVLDLLSSLDTEDDRR